MRGCSADRLAGCLEPEVFPAYAGMFPVRAIRALGVGGFPRVCGDVPKLKTSSKASTTFSPRMRGCSLFTGDLNFRDQVFPAYAGMFLVVVAWAEVSSQFSPRMRGCSGKHLMIDQNPDVFPAYAGMFRRYLSPDHGARRFPRVCGDVPIERALAVVLEKFSPRMRGCS